MARAGRLMKMYRLMFERFGHQNWWPGDTPFEICVGAILTQNTSWQNVERAIINLKKARCLSLKKINDLPPAELAALIRPAGYFNIKAKRLKNFTSHVVKHHGGKLKDFLSQPLDVLRAELLTINGVGPETADSITLYAADKPTFVIDAYTRRIFSRHGLCDKNADYHDIKKFCEDNLPRDVELYNDYHAQLVATAKIFCKTKAACDGCPLEKIERKAEHDG